jgi:hypothetical protein
MKTSITYLSATLIGIVLSHGQGAFQNLDFESARIVFTDPFNHVIATSNALPAWSAFSGTNQLTSIPYGMGGYVTAVTLVSQTNSGSISGVFSVVLGAGDGTAGVGGSVAQTGLMPADTQSLLFRVANGFFGGPFSVYLGGLELPYVALSSAPNYTLYGADVSPFAGQAKTLIFMAVGNSLVKLDDIQFSSQAIPEPSAAALLGLSPLVFAVCLFRRCRST